MVKIDNLYVFCISLNDRDDRREDILENFSYFNIIFFEAIDTRDEKWKKFSNYIDTQSYEKLIACNKLHSREYHHDLTSGAVGCFLSHLNLCQYIINHNLKYNFILEDDTRPLISNFKEYMSHLFEHIPEDADVVLLHYILPRTPASSITRVNNVVSRVNRENFQFWCTDSYILTLNGAKKIMENFDKIKIQYDSFLAKLYREGKINIYVCNKQYTVQNNSTTDIQNLRRVLYPNVFNF